MTNSDDIVFGPFLTNLFGDRYLHPVNHGVFNKLGSKEMYRQRYGELFAEKNSLFVVLGTDSGLLLKYLQNTELGSGCRLLVIEFPELISRIQDVMSFDSLPKNVILASPEDWQDKLEGLNFSTYVYLEKLQLLESFGAADGHLPEYKEVFWALQQRLELENWRIKAELGSELFFMRQLENLAENRYESYCLKDIFPGKTAVLLGAGPSLDLLLPWVMQNREKLVILAVSRISRRLQDVGLTPHMVFSTDPLTTSYRVCKEMHLFDKSVLFVGAYHACPQLVGQWYGRNLYVGPRVPWKSTLNRENYDLSGPTVTNTALNVARNMGFEKIILAGFDLCHSKEGYTHATGSNERETGPQIGRGRELLVETYAGYMAQTTQAYFSAMEDLALQAIEAGKQNCRLVNVAAGAAAIANIDFLPVDEITLADGSVDVESTLAAALPEDSAASTRRDFKEVLNELGRVTVRLKKIGTLAKEALDCNDGLFGRKGKVPDFKYKLKMDKIEKRLNRDFTDLVPLVKSFGLRWFVKTTRPDVEAEWSDEEIEETGRLYYETYVASCRELVTLISAASERIECRLEEFQLQPDFKKLFACWQRDKLPGRARLWLERYDKSSLAGDDLEQLREMAARFLAETQIPFVMDREEWFNPAGVKSKALLLYRRQALGELEQLQDGVANYREKLEIAQQIDYLLEGYIAELKDQPDLAFDAYHKLITDEIHPLTEEALVRIVSLSLDLEDRENALLALECLTGVAPNYQPNYAAMLKLLGRYEEAAEVYGDYLTKVPEDVVAMVKLGQLYNELNATDAACTAFRYVLELDPENSTAKILLAELEGNGC